MKPSLQPLAILGGRPAFAERLYVGRPNIGDRGRFLARVNDILDRRWLTNNGHYVHEFEKALAGLTGARHFIAACNGTVALELAVRALGLRGEVILPSFTFVATAHALQWQEITPVFCDIEPGSHTLDPARVEERITPRTSGIIGVHLWGTPCAVEDLAAIARRRDLRLVFDAAHALGSTRGGRPVGGFGDAEVFSFHATKFLNTFEGGGIATNDDELAARLRLMKNFGFAGYDEVVYLGTNGKMSEVQAAMGLTGVESLDEFIACNRRNHERYRAALAGLAGVRLLEPAQGERHNFQYVVLEIDETAALARDELLRVLWAENVVARRYFHPGCHRMEPYRTLFPDVAARLPVTERICRRVLVLPTGTAIGEAEIDAIGSILRAALARGAEVRAALARSPGP
ncbi:MAG TPA: aminotransferase class I/II-fold pyridoxal phosphate-dependent enzyme [Kiritimatiellia bacterium]|nr:aminotransferase class I/II-fold pyridoxal phosphate-dependent enzyme [Kiritimatiellia bacterium]HRZ13364.1 aminotransferase class I/II-fold pyridoxal phosphate-dependent enzyme [Kiritimatiellia bacterium]HSA18996.1 aminotransferase class I/II-fold pyridoxal phosphate-dependent enzyme [Kiritimatiellia bacterium]